MPSVEPQPAGCDPDLGYRGYLEPEGLASTSGRSSLTTTQLLSSPWPDQVSAPTGCPSAAPLWGHWQVPEEADTHFQRFGWVFGLNLGRQPGHRSHTHTHTHTGRHSVGVLVSPAQRTSSGAARELIRGGGRQAPSTAHSWPHPRRQSQPSPTLTSVPHCDPPPDLHQGDTCSADPILAVKGRGEPGGQVFTEQTRSRPPLVCWGQQPPLREEEKAQWPRRAERGTKEPGQLRVASGKADLVGQL